MLCLDKLKWAILILLGTCSVGHAVVNLDVDKNGATDINKGGTNATTAANARTALGVPSTAATLVGDCTVGPCLDGSSDGGNMIKLWAGTGSYWTALQGGASAANRSWRLPIAAPPSAGNTYLMNMDEYGQMGFISPSTYLTPSGSGAALTVDASGFDGNLATTDNTLQEIAQKLDDLTAGAGSDDQTASEVNITDAGTYFTGTTVEAALQEVGLNYALKSNYLALNNTTSFTPDADYEPATKKYVDDAITAGGGYTDEMAQDAVGGMFTGNTETGITVTYDDANAKVNFVVATQFDGSQSTSGSAGSISGMVTASGITGVLNLTKTGTTARTITFPDAAGTVALTSDISALSSVYQPLDSDLTTWAGVTSSVNGRSLVSAANYAAMRALLDLEVGTDFNAYDADLTTWAGITPGTGVGTFLATPSGANLASALTTALPASKGGTGLTALGTYVATAMGNATNAASGLVQLNASSQLPAVSAALLTNFPTLNQNTTGTSAGLSGTPNITVGTISAGAAGFAVDADGDVTAKSVTVTRTTSPTAVRFYEGTGGGDNYIDLTLSGNLAGDSTINLDALITTSAFDDTPDNGSTTTAPTANWAYDHVAAADPHTGYVLESAASANGLSLIGAANYAAMRGLLDLEAGTDFNAYGTIVSGASPTVDAAGEIALDTTSDQLIYYGGAKRVLTYKKQFDFAIKTPVDADDVLLFKAQTAITITDIHVIAQGGTSISVDIQECDSAGANCATVDAAITADTDGAEDDGTLSNGTIDAGDWVKLVLGAPSGTVNFLTGSIYYVETAN